MTSPTDPADIRLVVADDQASIREALATMLDLTDGLSVVASAADGEEAVAAAEAHRPDVVLMDLRMPKLDGIQATSQISQRFPEIAVVVLTTFDDEESIIAALGAGARGYLTKQAGRADIARAVQAAAAGQSVLDPAVQGRLLAAATQRAAQPAVPPNPAAPPATRLSARELKVLALIAEGLSNKEIAGRLFVSEATVKTHVNNIFSKAGLRDRAQAVHFAFTHGITGS